MKIKLGEVLKLNEELNLFLTEDIGHAIKYDLVLYTKKISDHIETAQESRKGLFLKLAEGQNEIPQFLEDGKTKNPIFEAINKEWLLLLSKEVEIDDPIKIDKSVLKELKSKNVYHLIYELMIEETKN